jgi:hypothetical protein
MMTDKHSCAHWAFVILRRFRPQRAEHPSDWQNAEAGERLGFLYRAGWQQIAGPQPNVPIGSHRPLTGKKFCA